MTLELLTAASKKNAQAGSSSAECSRFETKSETGRPRIGIASDLAKSPSVVFCFSSPRVKFVCLTPGGLVGGSAAYSLSLSPHLEHSGQADQRPGIVGEPVQVVYG